MGLNHQHQPQGSAFNQITTTTKTNVTSTNLIGPALSKLKTRDIGEKTRDTTRDIGKRGAKGYCTWTKDVVDLGGIMLAKAHSKYF